MEIKIGKKDKHVTIEISSEDLALGHILRKELIENKNVVFAGVAKRHPLVDKIEIQVETKKVDPIREIAISGDNAVKTSSELLNKFNKSLNK